MPMPKPLRAARGSVSLLAALLAGAASVFAFAPFGVFPLALLSLALEQRVQVVELERLVGEEL